MFNKIIISLIVLIYSGAYMSLHSTKIDTLTHYVKKSNVVYYKKDVNEYLVEEKEGTNDNKIKYLR